MILRAFDVHTDGWGGPPKRRVLRTMFLS